MVKQTFAHKKECDICWINNKEWKHFKKQTIDYLQENKWKKWLSILQK
jgi:hypothetical protein